MAKKSETSQVVGSSESDIAKEVTEKILELADIKTEVTVEKEGEETLLVNINGDDLGILIGFHGETLKALQVILGVLINREIKERSKNDTAIWYRVLVDVGDWRNSRQAALEEMAQRAAIKVKETLKPIDLPPMSPDERRLVHLYLETQEGVTTTSEGVGEHRHIVILPAQND